MNNSLEALWPFNIPKVNNPKIPVLNELTDWLNQCITETYWHGVIDGFLIASLLALVLYLLLTAKRTTPNEKTISVISIFICVILVFFQIHYSHRELPPPPGIKTPAPAPQPKPAKPWWGPFKAPDERQEDVSAQNPLLNGVCWNKISQTERFTINGAIVSRDQAMAALDNAPPVTAITIGGPIDPTGKSQVAIDLPQALRLKNVGGTDGAGLCVFTSITHAARWAGEHRLEDLQLKMRKEPGGGYPEKVDKMIAKYGPGTEYIQYEGTDPAILIAALKDKADRMPCITWDGTGDPHYHGRIAHMVNLVCYDTAADRACILDNNFIGPNEQVWMSCKELQRGWTGSQSAPGQKAAGWAIILLNHGPPPPPHN